MARLYPPIIDGVLPAFQIDQQKDEDDKIDSFLTLKLSIPFTMNATVNESNVAGYAIKLRSISTNRDIIVINTAKNDFNNDKSNNYYADYENGILSCYYVIRDKSIMEAFTPANHYKIQIAYVFGEKVEDEDDAFDQSTLQVGYYSTTGIIKCTTVPQVYIDNLSINETNIHLYNYVGVYSQQGKFSGSIDKDASEKLYSSRFIVNDKKTGTIIIDTGEIIHKINEDTEPDQAKEIFKYENDITDNNIYEIQYFVTTVNGVVAESPKYSITQVSNNSSELLNSMQFTVENDTDNGVIKVYLFQPEFNKNGDTNFVLSRAAGVEGNVWKDLKKFTITNEQVSGAAPIFIDYTVEQGTMYRYGIQQINRFKVRSSRKATEPILADFEDMFLFDGERQLKIRFNPKVSSFKRTVSETKIETLGNQYPTILRNGYIGYNEFPISGLLSYQLDDKRTFIKIKELAMPETPIRYNGEQNEDLNIYDDSVANSITKAYYKNHINGTVETNLTSYNMTAERKFKMEVLSWLNDGKSKIFRSPAEGNYIVRLMNTSLSPMDQLGRMLHSFTCTAYEIAPFNHETLLKEGFLNLGEIETHKVKKITSFNLQSNTGVISASHKEFKAGSFNNRSFYMLKHSFRDGGTLTKISFNNFKPGTIIRLVRNTIRDDGTEGGSAAALGDGKSDIVIGPLGMYEYEHKSNDKIINNFWIFNDNLTTNDIEKGMQIVIQYSQNSYSPFDYVNGIELYQMPLLQFRGALSYLDTKTYNPVSLLPGYQDDENIQLNFLNYISNEQASIRNIYALNFYKRDVMDLYIYANNKGNGFSENDVIFNSWKDSNGSQRLRSKIVNSINMGFMKLDMDSNTTLIDKNSLNDLYVYRLCVVTNTGNIVTKAKNEVEGVEHYYDLSLSKLRNRAQIFDNITKYYGDDTQSGIGERFFEYTIKYKHDESSKTHVLDLLPIQLVHNNDMNEVAQLHNKLTANSEDVNINDIEYISFGQGVVCEILFDYQWKKYLFSDFDFKEAEFSYINKSKMHKTNKKNPDRRYHLMQAYTNYLKQISISAQKQSSGGSES